MPLRDMGREQLWMLPPTLDELLPLDHPARFVAEFVDALDRDGWAELGVDIAGDALGAPAYHPRALLSVWLYGFMTGVRSCRKLEAACRDQIPYLWLTGWQRPDHNTLWRFYKGHRQAMRKLFEHTVRTAVAMKLVDLAIQAVDGTKVVANASLNRSYDAEGLRGLLVRVERAIGDLEAQNEAGEDAAAAHLPEELANKEVLRDKVKQAMADLAGQERHKRINLTDPDARLMKGRQGIVAGYNAQAMVSPTEPEGGMTGMLVTAVDVVDEANDNAMLAPMMERAEETTGTKAQTTLADAGYFAGSHLEECASRGQQVVVSEARQRFLKDPYHKDQFTYDEQSDRFTCPQGQTLAFVRIQHANGVPLRLYRASGAVCQACPAFGVCTRAKEIGRSLAVGPHDAALRRHRAWMATSAAKQAYRLRKQLVEPVFGIIKEQQGHGGSYCAASSTWRPSGPCWPQLSTCAPCGGPGAPAPPSSYPMGRISIPLPDSNCAGNHPSPILRHLQLSRQESFSKPHWLIPTAPTCYPLHHFWDRLSSVRSGPPAWLPIPRGTGRRTGS